jgi:hypothetical protein
MKKGAVHARCTGRQRRYHIHSVMGNAMLV